MDLNKDEIERAFAELEKKAKDKAEDVQEDLEEEYQEVRKDMKSWYAKTNDWIMKNLVIVVLVIVAGVAAVVYTTPIMPKSEKVEAPAPVKTVEVLKEKIEEVDNSRLITLNRDNLLVTRTRVTTSRITNKELFIIYMKNKEDNLFLTLIKNVEDLDGKDKKLYEDFVKKEQEKILKETK